MNLLAELFNNQQNLMQNPTSTIRTPIQEAYDTLLNRQYEINQQNKKNNLVNGLMSGMGGLGKILASAIVKNPMQQYGAMKGLTEQESRIDDLQQAYNRARQQQNQDYVNQAKEQLNKAITDEEKDYQRGLQKTQAEISAKQYADKLAQIGIENEMKQNAQDETARHNKAMEDIARANMSSSASSKDLSPEEKIKIETNTKKQLELQNDLNKIVANKDAFDEKMKGIDSLAQKQGNVLTRAWETATMSGNRLSNAQNVKAQLIQATLDAYGVPDSDRGDEKKVAQIVSQVGIGKGALSKKDIKFIKDNISKIYETRINQKNNELSRLLNPTSIGVENEDTGGL